MASSSENAHAAVLKEIVSKQEESELEEQSEMMDTFEIEPSSVSIEKTTNAERAAGVLLGLAAGDKNGGPQRLALLLAYSVFVNGKFDAEDVWSRYAKWYDTGGFDTGMC